jgi:predicted nucleotidyltransferase
MAVTIEQIGKAIDLSKKYDVNQLILFGSSLEDITAANDLDLAVSGIDGWKFFELSARLEEELELNIDLIPLDDDSNLSKHIRKVGKILYERR